MQLQLPWKSRHKPRNFQNLKCKLAANALDISVTLFYTIDLENSTFILTRRGAEAILVKINVEFSKSIAQKSVTEISSAFTANVPKHLNRGAQTRAGQPNPN